jgi:hypothetical protein
MGTYKVALLLLAFGLVGGALNALFENEGFVFPKTESLHDGHKIFRPASLGT